MICTLPIGLPQDNQAGSDDERKGYAEIRDALGLNLGLGFTSSPHLAVNDAELDRQLLADADPKPGPQSNEHHDCMNGQDGHRGVGWKSLDGEGRLPCQ